MGTISWVKPVQHHNENHIRSHRNELPIVTETIALCQLESMGHRNKQNSSA